MVETKPISPAERYECEMVPAMFLPFAEELVGRLPIQDGMRVVDVGCGTGVVARLIGGKLGSTSTVIGVDINPGMLSVAKSKTQSLACHFEWHEASAEAMPLDDGSVDLVVSQHAFMLFPDKVAAAGEMHRVLRTGGAVYVSAWRHFRHQPHYASLIEGLGAFVSVEAADLMKTPFLFDSHAELRSLINAGGFAEVRVETVVKEVRFPSPQTFVRTIIAGSILARMGIHVPDPALEKLCAFVARALERYSSASEMIVPMESYVAAARK